MAHLARQQPSLLLHGYRRATNLSSAAQPQRRSLSSTAMRGQRADSTEALASTSSSSSSSSSPSDKSGGRGRRGQVRGRFPSYKDWIRTAGKQYEKPPPGLGPFWLGPTPFPMNPYFVPVAPTAYSIKNTMWQLHISDPRSNSVRNLSAKFGIPVERVTAILRLMALENELQRAGKPPQMPFQKQMERLMGSVGKPELIRREQQALAIAPAGSVAGKSYEELGAGEKDKDLPSAINPLLSQSAMEKRDRIRKMPTGGPAAKGAALTSVRNEGTTNDRSRPNITFVDLSSRPTSYSGASIVKRNAKRAADRKANKDRRRAADEKWQQRTALAERIKAGERTPEILEQKRLLDEEKRAEDVRIDRLLLRQFKSKTRVKKAMKRIAQLNVMEREKAKQKAESVAKRLERVAKESLAKELSKQSPQLQSQT